MLSLKNNALVIQHFSPLSRSCCEDETAVSVKLISLPPVDARPGAEVTKKNPIAMASSYNAAGLLWSFLSFSGALLCSFGFYMPYWLEGTMKTSEEEEDLEVFLSTFRRCNYPVLDRDSGTITIVRQCGRYTTFGDIPAVSWQVACVACGIGSGLAMLVALISLAGCCISDLISHGVAKSLGGIQLFSGLLIGAGCALFPQGWGAKEVKDVCGGNSDSYQLGNCSLFWAYYLTIIGAGMTCFCFGLSFIASSSKKHRYSSV